MKLVNQIMLSYIQMKFMLELTTPLSGFLAALYVATYKGGSRHMERTTVSHEDQVLQQEQPCPHTGKVDPAFWILAWSGPAARIAVHCVDRSSQPAEGRWYASRCHI